MRVLVVATCAFALRAEAAPPADGAVLAVTRPRTFQIDFGTIARGQLSSREVTIHNPGNAPLDIALGTPGAPFAAPPMVSIGPGGTESFEITCRSQMPVMVTDEDVTLTSNATQSNTAGIAVRCAVADTRLEIMPGTLDFKEVRSGTMPRTIAITLRNPGPGPMLLEQVRLDGAPEILRLQPDVMPNHMLGPGGTLALMLTVTPSASVELDGAKLVIAIDAAQLELPISGEVVTPSARVSPSALDLGTACVGTQVTGSVRLTNSGTATLTMQRPVMDRAFTTVPELPQSYPASLAPGYDATVGVSPRTSMIGPIDGTLTWDVDAPNGPFSVPVMLRYIDAGTAISPRSLIFGSIDAGQASPRQTVTLENCNPMPIRLSIEGVVASQGDLGAWEVSPSTDERTLGPRDKLQLAAVFRPKRVGHHVAHIRFSIDDEPGEIELTGDALGEVPERRSFYACDCRSPASPAPGAPIALAVLLVLRRRRSSSLRGRPRLRALRTAAQRPCSTD